MSMSIKASPDGTFGEILVNGAVVAKLPVTGNAVIPGLVGTVSQSGGVPTGAIIETGTNANGTYIKYACGTMICHGIVSKPSGTTVTTQAGVTGLYWGGDVTWTYPAAFLTIPTVSVGVSRSSSDTNAAWGAARGISGSSVSLRYWSNVSSDTLGLNFLPVAIGRWF